MFRKSLHLSLIFILAVGAVAQQQQRADDVPSVEGVRAHIEYLASDKLQGRRTGTAEAMAAANYIAREFARYGLRRSNGVDLPGMSIIEADSPRRYMQEFPFVASVALGQGNILSLQTKPKAAALRVGEDWMPLGFSSNGRIENAPAVFVNYGISAKELNHDDYASVDVKDKVVIALDGTPDKDNPHGPFARYTDPRWKALAAKDRGARALVLLSHEDKFSDERLASLRYDNGGEAGLPVIVLSKSAGDRFVGTGEIDKLSWFLVVDIARKNAPAANVIGILEGSDPQLKQEAIVIGAHYDHLGTGGEGSLAPREGEVHHGADDNASGVAAVLELARILSAERAQVRRTIIFIAFSGEEEGLIGSNFYVNHPVVPLAETVAMINMDMIGRLKENKLIIGGVGTAAEWREMIAAANTSQGMNVAASAATTQAGATTKVSVQSVPIVTGTNGGTVLSRDLTAAPFALTLNEDGYGPSDHSSFYAKQVPVLFFWTGTHEDYHKPSDTADKINYEGEARVIQMVLRIARAIEANQKRPTYAVAKSESTGRSMGFRVYLGTIPNYAESSDGLKLDGVRDDSPAARAGLKAGDRITRLAGREIKNVYDYTYALGEMKAGEEYEVEVVRGSETLKLKITPAARK